ncbi:hypothetical protein SK128_027115 [Halocaridina rubra]|uniref:Uncharacterized protein n=1 Tax=Halocaridina rubra TaxID=373956 RepID=A0AAN8X3I6_HALRR
MMLSRAVLLCLLASSVLAEEAAPESVMEKPLLKVDATSATDSDHQEAGGEASNTRKYRMSETELSERQGPLQGMDVVTMTVNALNPMPYLIGGLKGVRGVMRERFFPWSGMMINNFQRTLPRPLPRYRYRGGNGGGHGGHMGHAGNGAGGSDDERFREDGRGSGGGGIGSSQENFRENGGFGRGTRRPFNQHFSNMQDDINTLMTDDPLRNMHGHQHKNPQSGFDTPKPHSILSTSKPASFRTTRGPRPLHNTQRPRTISNTHRPRPIISTLRPDTVRKPNKISFHNSSPNVNHSSHPKNNNTPSSDKKKVIIEIPKELQDIAVLEVSMHSNGDISIGPGSTTTSKTTQAPPSPSPITISDKMPPAFLPLFPPFPPGMNEHGFMHGNTPELRSSYPSNIHHGFNTNQNGRVDSKANILCVRAKREDKINSIQDVLRMQNSKNIDKIGENEINFELNCVRNQQATPYQSHSSPFSNEPHPMQLPTTYLRENPVPHFSANFGPDKHNINHIYFVPISMPLSQTSSNSHLSSASAQVPQHAKPKIHDTSNDNPVYYIDITIPGNTQEDPLVTTKVARKKRSLQFDGWYPLDVSNPMSDDPTIGYQPPPLERVHFSDEPVTKNPLFPVKPKNPTVFVVRSEPKEPQYHSVYGTENIEYFHIHPQTNTIRAFRSPSQSVGAIQFISAPQFGDTGEHQQSDNYQESLNENQGIKKGYFYSDIPNKEPGFSDKSDIFDDVDYDQDMEGSFSEYSVIAHPYRWRNRNRSNPQRFRYSQLSSPRRRQDFIDIPPSREPENRRSSQPALYELLGNFKYESQIEETPYLGSATDSAKTAIFREVPPPEFFQNRPLRKNNIPISGPRGPAYRQTGLDADESSSRPWYLINTKSERRREPSIASYIHPETRLGDERVHYKPLGPVSYVSKETEKERIRDPFYNPHLDDHMNSYKPSTSLTANSLSELLQIFRFTQVTDKPGRGITDEPITFVREFRYTRPTEETPTTIPTFDEEPQTTFKYTSTPPTVTETTMIDTTSEVAKNVRYDAVADTNSIDGYLFSDSEASPEYAHPEVKPNIIAIHGKGLDTSKGIVKDDGTINDSTSSSTSPFEPQSISVTQKELRPAFDNLEIIYPGRPPKITTSTPSSWPLYIIHEGHSKVRVFGINTAADKPSSFKSSLKSVPIIESSTITSTSQFTTTKSLPNITTTDTFIKTPFLVYQNSTTESTPTATTTSSTTTGTSTQNLNDYDLTSIVSRHEYDYYYYDEGDASSDLAFGEEYYTEGVHTSALEAPISENPLLIPSYRLLTGDLDTSEDTDTFSHIFQDRLPRAYNPASPKSDQMPLLPAVKFTREQLSEARPVFFTKRQQKTEIVNSDESVSQPFEYLSHLQQLKRERIFATKENSTNLKAADQDMTLSKA